MFGELIGTGSAVNVFYGYPFAAVLMVLAAVAELLWGVSAERDSVETITPPLSVAEAER